MTIIKLGHLEIDIDVDDFQEQNEMQMLRLIVAQLRHQQKQIKFIMIEQKVLDDSLKALTDAVANITSGAPSTPDSQVQAYVTGVDTNTAHILAGSTPPPPPTP